MNIVFDLGGVATEQPWAPDPVVPVVPVVQVQNQPNPFNPSTEIRYWLDRAEGVTVRVFDLRGQEVCALVNAVQPAGWNAVRWNGLDDTGRNVPTGAYFARVATESSVASCRMMLVR